MNQNLFSYGTLQNTEVQLRLFGRLLNGTKVILKGYKLCQIEINDELFLAQGDGKFQMTLIPSKDVNNLIEGTIFELSESELLSADSYEPDNYKRIEIELESGKRVWIYTADLIN